MRTRNRTHPRANSWLTHLSILLLLVATACGGPGDHSTGYDSAASGSEGSSSSNLVKLNLPMRSSGPNSLDPVKGSTTYQFINRDRFFLPFDPNGVQLSDAKGIISDEIVRELADHDIGAVLLVNPFQARSQINVIAHDGVVEAIFRAHIPDAHISGINTDPDIHEW